MSFFPKLKDLIVRLRTGLDLYNYEEWNQYKISDIYILLSKTYKDEFLHHIKIKDSTKLRWINNPLSFPFVDTQSARLKQVLIIARMDERQKNLTAAMRIWREIERRGNNDWTLIMGGYGNDENMILDYAKSIGIKRMNFVGKAKDPRNLYIKSSIFMMTSNYEGFPMVLTEALQFGCVPLAFDTYTALHDMVNDGYNGYIIQNKDEKDYADKLESLMNNTSRIKEMSFNAINSSKKFSIDVIGQKWLELINEFNHDI